MGAKRQHLKIRFPINIYMSHFPENKARPGCTVPVLPHNGGPQLSLGGNLRAADTAVPTASCYCACERGWLPSLTFYLPPPTALGFSSSPPNVIFPEISSCRSSGSTCIPTFLPFRLHAPVLGAAAMPARDHLQLGLSN